jgi:hypothetical protein
MTCGSGWISLDGPIRHLETPGLLGASVDSLRELERQEGERARVQRSPLGRARWTCRSGWGTDEIEVAPVVPEPIGETRTVHEFIP